jgi:hypothetical protein
MSLLRSRLESGKAEKVRVLLAYEEEYRVYTEAIAEAIHTFRSHHEVALTNTQELEAQVERFDPQLVICSSPIPSNPVDPQLIASMELSPEPDQASRFRVGERHWESTNPTLGETLSVVDETYLLYSRISHEKEPIGTNGEVEA